MAEASISATSTVRWLTEASARLHDARDELTELDAARGDADHGANMDRGFQAVADGLAEESFESPHAVLLRASALLRRTMGGTSGPLWSVGLRRMALSLGTEPVVDARSLGAALLAAAEGISELGGAQEGDNTMVDVLLPVGRELKDRLEAGMPVADALARASSEARERAQATASRSSTKGRASYLGDRAIGVADPGATSASIIVTALIAAAADAE
jgi:dihydroxyacetone kinase-like protein